VPNRVNNNNYANLYGAITRRRLNCSGMATSFIIIIVTTPSLRLQWQFSNEL